MSREDQIIRQFAETASVYICETRSATKTEENDLLSYAELSFLLCIEAHCGSNSAQISSLMGMTRGAVTQQAGKLKKRGYIESYKQDGNKKEVFYRLTNRGNEALGLIRQSRDKANMQVAAYLQTLSEKELKAVEGFLGQIVDAVDSKKDCYIQMKNSEQGRCEKCKIHY